MRLADGSFWYAGSQAISHLATDGTVTTYPLANSDHVAASIAKAGDGSIWFLELKPYSTDQGFAYVADSINRIANDGTVTSYSLAPYGYSLN